MNDAQALSPAAMIPALGGGPARWTPECLDPEQIIGLIQQGGTYPGASQLWEHASWCGWCRREYLRTQRDLAAAAGSRAVVRPLWSAPHRATSAPASFDLTRVSASNTDGPPSGVRTFCDGALLATLWLEDDRLLLTLEHNCSATWRLDEHDEPSLEPRRGVSLAGELVYFELQSPQLKRSGYVVMPETCPSCVAEVVLGPGINIEEGSIVCEHASPEDLDDASMVRDSIRGTNTTTCAEAWLTYAQEHPDLPWEVINAIRVTASLPEKYN